MPVCRWPFRQSSKLSTLSHNSRSDGISSGSSHGPGETAGADVGSAFDPAPSRRLGYRRGATQAGTAMRV